MSLAGKIETEPLSDIVEQLVASEALDSLLESNVGLFRKFMERLAETLERAFVQGCPRSLFDIHKTLYVLYEENLETPRPGSGQNQFHPFVIRVRNDIEQAWEAAELRRIDLRAEDIPDEEGAFLEFLQQRCLSHRLATHPLFDFLENEASYEQIVNFFLHEGTLVLRFCDLIVLSMLGVHEEVRSELAENFWDEVGNGDYRNRHTALFTRLLRHVGVEPPTGRFLSRDFISRLDWQGLAGYNLYFYLSLHRRNYFKSVAGLGIAEVMDVAQYEKIVRGCRRVGFRDRQALAYYIDHVEVDKEHGDGWMRNVVGPLVRRHPEARYDMIVGGLMRANTAADYYDFLLDKLRREPNDIVPLVPAEGAVAASAGAA